MRLLSRTMTGRHLSQKTSSLQFRCWFGMVLGSIVIGNAGCSSAGGGIVKAPPPQEITVTVTPPSGTILLGATLSFTATVLHTSDTSVMWSVNNIPGGAPQVGTISSSGLYSAPARVPQGGTIQVTATSHADSIKSGTAAVSVTSDISVSISPASSNV
jgi:hypothetical protein